MSHSAGGYFQELTQRFGRGWNRFWYTPSDPLTLGVIRLATGLLALYFLLSYTPDLVRFFGDGGLLPTSLTAEANSSWDFNPGNLSYLTYLHAPAALYAAHALGAAVLVLMTIGLFSRVTTVLGLGVVLSYIYRAPMITSQVETILAMLMFYLCFAPTGAALAVDSWWARRRGGANLAGRKTAVRRYFSATVVTRLIQIHVAAVCLMMGLAMIRGSASVVSEGNVDWRNPWGAGEAVWLMIARPESAWFDLTWLRGYPVVINLWTHAIVLFELAFGVLIWNRLARPLLLGIAVVMWGGLAAISGIAPFSAAMLIGSLAFVSPEYLRRLTGGGSTAPEVVALKTDKRQPGIPERAVR